MIGVGGKVSLGILKALRNSSLKNLHIIGACVKKESAGFAFCDEALLCPFAKSNEFENWLKGVEREYSVDIVLSGVEEVNIVLANFNTFQHKPLYLVPEAHNLNVFNDKLKTINWLKKNGIDCPETIELGLDFCAEELVGRLETPFIVKPRDGKGSASIHIINEIEQVQPFIQSGGYVAQELVGSQETEFTCGVYKSPFGYIEVIVMKRALENGSTSIAEVVFDSDIEDYCRKIARNCDTSSPFNIQLRVCEKRNKPYCFEINMRLSGTTAIRHNFGFKDCEAWIREKYLKNSAKQIFNVSPGLAVRYEEEVYYNRERLDSLATNKAIEICSGLVV